MTQISFLVILYLEVVEVALLVLQHPVALGALVAIRRFVLHLQQVQRDVARLQGGPVLVGCVGAGGGAGAARTLRIGATLRVGR